MPSRLSLRFISWAFLLLSLLSLILSIARGCYVATVILPATLYPTRNGSVLTFLELLQDLIFITAIPILFFAGHRVVDFLLTLDDSISDVEEKMEVLDQKLDRTERRIEDTRQKVTKLEP